MHSNKSFIRRITQNTQESTSRTQTKLSLLIAVSSTAFWLYDTYGMLSSAIFYPIFLEIVISIFAWMDYCSGEYKTKLISFYNRYNYYALMFITLLLMTAVHCDISKYVALDTDTILSTGTVSEKAISSTLNSYSPQNPAHKFLASFLRGNGLPVYRGVWHTVKTRASYLNTLYTVNLLAKNSIVQNFGFLGNYQSALADYTRYTSAKVGIFNTLPNQLKSLILEKYILSKTKKAENNMGDILLGDNRSISGQGLSRILHVVSKNPRISIPAVEQYAAYHRQYLHQSLPQIQQEIAKQLGNSGIH